MSSAPAADLSLDRLVCHSNMPMQLGCARCAEQALCGGISIKAPLYTCVDLCCGRPQDCPLICPRKPVELAAAHQEVKGWSFTNLPRSKPIAVPRLPAHVPSVINGSRRIEPLQIAAAAIPLKMLFNGATGKPAFRDRGEVGQHFKVSPETALVVDGVSTDQPLENYWGRARDAGIVENLRNLGPALVTVPNFSLIADAPRHNDLYNMKRQLWAWHELNAAGLPAALHANARSDRDYARLGEFLRHYTEVQMVSFEFATGARRRSRKDWHVKHLCRLPEMAGRPLRLVVRGGIRVLPRLAAHFQDTVFIDTAVPMKTVMRQRSQEEGGSRSTYTLTGQDLDDLFRHNAAVRRARVERVLASSSPPYRP